MTKRCCLSVSFIFDFLLKGWFVCRGATLLDPKWLDALSLPAKVTGGFLAFFVLAIVADKYVIALLGSWMPYFVLGALLTGCLFAGAMIEATAGFIIERGKPAKIARKRQAVREDQSRERALAEAERDLTVRRRIDTLSSDEIRHVAKALRDGSQSFKAYVNDPDLSNLMHKGLLTSPGGPHHQDYYPFTFPDFVWSALLEKKDVILAKDEAQPPKKY